MRPVVFSASSVWTYQQCSLQWWFAYVLAHPGEPSDEMAVGAEVHDGVERILKGGEAVGSVVTDPLYTVFREDILPTYGTPVLVEEPFQIEVNEIPYSGVIDSLDQRVLDWFVPDEPLVLTILRDLKTTGKRPSPGRYRFNMIGYYLGVRDLGYHVDRIQLDYIVRTKTPYYWPEIQQIPDEQEIAVWAAELEAVADQVARGIYEPDGLFKQGICKRCPYTAICGPYQRLNEQPQPDDGPYNTAGPHQDWEE